MTVIVVFGRGDVLDFTCAYCLWYKIITGKYDSDCSLRSCVYIQILCMLSLLEGINLN